MKFRTKAKVNSEIPTSSMSDIAFLLIIFFMVTTAFAARKGIDFRLPKQDSQEDVVETTDGINAVHIHILESGRLMIDQRPANLADIQPYLMPKLAVNPHKFVIIQTDYTATYGDMIDVLDELKQANVEHIVLPTKEDVASWGDLGM
ncbi:biopolymer transporter ExbD [bacterium]|nr:biopolymer transporter ExbD [candidate division CSSED10-310 bacterium]